MSKDFKATIRENSPRAASWREVFGSFEIYLRSPTPELASAPGVEAGLFYQIDLQELTEIQRARMIAYIAKKFHIDEQEVADTLDDVGCPILADDITIVVYNPLKWI